MGSQKDQHGMSYQFVPRQLSLDQCQRVPHYHGFHNNTVQPANPEPPPIRPIYDNFVRPQSTYVMNGGEFPFNASSPNLQYMQQNQPLRYPIDNRSQTPDPERTKKISYPFPKPSYQTHRRVRSGDSVVWESNRQSSPDLRQHTLASPQSSNSRLIDYNTGRFPTGLQLNLSQPYSGQSDIENMYGHTPILHPLHVNIPEEEKAPDQKQQHYLIQVNSFMKLNQAIETSEHLRDQLEGEVRKMEDELNSRSAVEKNPTEKDFARLKDENEYLMKEIREMQAELDRLNIPYPGDPINQNQPARPVPPILPVDLPFNPTGPDNILVRTLSNSSGNSHTSPVAITTQPTTSTRPVSGVTYENVDIVNMRPRPTVPPPSFTPSISEVPPIPPRIPTNNPEKWRCPKCTFDNLYLTYCEICGEFRPTNVNMVKSS